MTLDEVMMRFQLTYNVTREELEMFNRRKPYPDLIAIFSYNAKELTGLRYTQISAYLKTHRHNIRAAKNRYELYYKTNRPFKQLADKFKP